MIWALAGDERLSRRVASVIASPESEAYVSAASIWEISIKRSLGKLEVTVELPDKVREAGFAPLVVSMEHAMAAGALPRHHGDPFDRMLVAQAQLEGLTLVTADPQLSRYAVHTLDATAEFGS